MSGPANDARTRPAEQIGGYKKQISGLDCIQPRPPPPRLKPCLTAGFGPGQDHLGVAGEHRSLVDYRCELTQSCKYVSAAAEPDYPTDDLLSANSVKWRGRYLVEHAYGPRVRIVAGESRERLVERAGGIIGYSFGSCGTADKPDFPGDVRESAGPKEEQRQTESPERIAGGHRRCASPGNYQIGIECCNSFEVDPECITDARQLSRSPWPVAVRRYADKASTGSRGVDDFGYARCKTHDPLRRRRKLDRMPHVVGQGDWRASRRAGCLSQQQQKSEAGKPAPARQQLSGASTTRP